MLDSIFTEYKFENKTTLAKILDYALYPTRQLLNFKTIQYDPQTKSFREEDQKCKNIFCKILLAVVAVALVPLTLVVCLIKALDHTAQKVHQQYQLKSQAGHSNESKDSSEENSSEELRSDRTATHPRQQASTAPFTRLQLEQLLQPYSEAWRRQVDLDRMSAAETENILRLLGELSGLFGQLLTSDRRIAENGNFIFAKFRQNVFLFQYKLDPEPDAFSPMSTEDKRLMLLFQVYIESLEDVVIGTSESSSDNAFFIYHKNVVNDPFDAEHIVCRNNPPTQLLLRSGTKRWVLVDDRAKWPAPGPTSS